MSKKAEEANNKDKDSIGIELIDDIDDILGDKKNTSIEVEQTNEEIKDKNKIKKDEITKIETKEISIKIDSESQEKSKKEAKKEESEERKKITKNKIFKKKKKKEIPIKSGLISPNKTKENVEGIIPKKPEKEEIVEEEKKEDGKKEKIERKTKKIKPEFSKKKLFAIIAVLLLVVAVFAYYNNDNTKKELLIVKVPTERIGDKATYDVNSLIKTTAQTGISTPWGDIKSLNISFTGPMIIQTNETTEKEDGFGEKHHVIDRYITQKLNVGGTVEIDLGFIATLHPDGYIETKENSYTDLKTNTTIQRKIINNVNVYSKAENIGNMTVGSLVSKDKIRFYTPPKEYLAYTSDYLNILSDVVPKNRTIKEGDEYTSSNGNNTYSWKAEGVDYIYEREALRINITMDNFLTTHNFSNFNAFVWIANEISMPVKFLLKGEIDLSEFSISPISFQYMATMTDYEQGEDPIPYGDCDAKHFYEKRPGYDNEFISEKNWEYVPSIGNMATSFDRTFTGENASIYAYNNSTGNPNLKGYLDWHASGNPFVVQGYYNETSNKTWNLTFAYRNNRREDIYVDGYNVIITKNATNITAEGKIIESIREPLIEKKDIKESLSFSAAEDIFKKDNEIYKKAFSNDRIDFTRFNFGIKVNVMPSFNLLGFDLDFLNSFEVTGGYNYYLEKRTNSGDSMDLFRATIDGQNGQMLYVIEHSQTIEDITSIFV